LKGVELSEDESVVGLGSGLTWMSVYKELEQKGLMVTGGRVGSVGVGGFTLGGGISFLDNLYGWACDNVRNFEVRSRCIFWLALLTMLQVVLANGSIVNANVESHPDLYFALRGGGNNFGIVTRFDYETRRHGQMWGGNQVMFVEDIEERRAALGLEGDLVWDLKHLRRKALSLLNKLVSKLGFSTRTEDLIKSWASLANKETADPLAHAYLYFAWVPYMHTWLQGSTLTYIAPEKDPRAVGLKNIASLNAVYRTTRVANLTDLVQEIEDMNDYEQRYVERREEFTDLSQAILGDFDVQTRRRLHL
jgi:hypothetical protein